MALSERNQSLGRRHGPDRNGSFRGAYRYGNKEKAAEALHTEVTSIALGEPSTHFFPPIIEDNIATKEDFEKRIAEQNERCLLRLQEAGWDPANLPVSWRRYMIGHWDELKTRL